MGSEKRMECERNMAIMAKETSSLQDNVRSVTCKATEVKAEAKKSKKIFEDIIHAQESKIQALTMQLQVIVDKEQTTQQECLKYERLFNEENAIRIQESAVACEEKAKASNLNIELNVAKSE